MTTEADKKLLENFLKSKDLKVKDMYSGYTIPYTQLCSLLQEYTDLQLARKLEKAGRELPTHADLIREFSNTTLALNPMWVEGCKWMKEKASTIIASLQSNADMWKGEFDSQVHKCNKLLMELHEKDAELSSYRSLLDDAVVEVQKKDKEIDDIKKWINENIAHYEALEKLGKLMPCDQCYFDCFKSFKSFKLQLSNKDKA